MRSFLLPLLAFPLALAACSSEPTLSAPGGDEANIRPATKATETGQLVSDGRTDGDEHFYFLWPITWDRVPSGGDFDSSAEPTVSVCLFVDGACTETVADFPFREGPGGGLATTRRYTTFEFFLATWATKRQDAGKEFRAIVKVHRLEVGYVDISLVQRARDLRDVPADNVGVVAGWPLPIPFRVETGLARPTRPCESGSLSVVVAEGATGYPGSSRVARCGERIGYSYQSAQGYGPVRAFLNGEEVAAEGALYVSGADVLTVAAAKQPSPSAAVQQLSAAFDRVLLGSDKATEYRAFLEELVVLDDLVGGLSHEAIKAAIGDAENDPARAGLLAPALTEIGGMIFIPDDPGASGLIASSLGGPSGRQTMVLHVNGVLSSHNGAIENFLELRRVVKETTLPNTVAAFSYNPSYFDLSSNSQPAIAIRSLQCSLDAVSQMALQTIWQMQGALSFLYNAYKAGMCLSQAPAATEIFDLFEAARQIAGLPIASKYPKALARDLHYYLSTGRQVVVVPHSQGNMMLRDAVAEPAVTAADANFLTAIALAPQRIAPTSRLAKRDCWMVADELFTVLPNLNECHSGESPLLTALSVDKNPAYEAAAWIAGGCYRLFSFCNPLDYTPGDFDLAWQLSLHSFVKSYLYAESRALLKRKLQEHKNFLDAQQPPPPPPGCGAGGVVFCDDFSGSLASWTNPTGQGSWAIQNGELVGDYGIGCGSPSCPQADLLVNSAVMPASGNWRAEVEVVFTQRYCCFNGGAEGTYGDFSLFVSASEKESLGAGKAWAGVPAPAASTDVTFAHQAFPWTNLIVPYFVAVPSWDPRVPQRMTLQKQGNTYTLSWNGQVLYSVNRNFSSPPRVGLHTYGRSVYDNFRLYALP